MTVILSSPYMDEASRCHRVGLLDNGSLLAEGEPEQLTAAFSHITFSIQMKGRDQIEDLVKSRPGVLAVSPEGSALRAVVHKDSADEFETWIDAHRFTVSIERVTPTFEDVFLGLLEDPTAMNDGVR